jgi:hypothetical protein
MNANKQSVIFHMLLPSGAFIIGLIKRAQIIHITNQVVSELFLLSMENKINDASAIYLKMVKYP